MKKVWKRRRLQIHVSLISLSWYKSWHCTIIYHLKKKERRNIICMTCCMKDKGKHMTVFHSLPCLVLVICLMIVFKAMKMSRRSADASQRSLAYNRIVDALNEFRWAYSFKSCAAVLLLPLQSFPLSWQALSVSARFFQHFQVDCLLFEVKYMQSLYLYCESKSNKHINDSKYQPLY